MTTKLQIEFSNLLESEVWKRMEAEATAIIEEAKEEVFVVADAESQEKRQFAIEQAVVKAAHYKDFWERLKLFIHNSVR